MRVRYFAGAAEAAGRDEQEIDGPATVGLLRAQLSEEHGTEFTRVLDRCALLVDGARGEDDLVLSPSSSIDVLPPFAGG